MKIRLTKSAVRSVRKLDFSVQQRIRKKLFWLAEQKDPCQFAETLTDGKIGQFRFRIGDYRVIFDVADDSIIVLLIGHRREIYR